MRYVELNLNEAERHPVSIDVFIQELLKKERLFSSDFLFTVVDGDGIGQFLKRGTYRKGNKIFSFRHTELCYSSNDPTETNTLNDWFQEYDNPIVAVYRASYLEETGIPYEFKFKDPAKKIDALEAIIMVV